MSQFLRILIAFVLAIILSVILTPFFGGLYDHFFIVNSWFFWGPSHPEYIPGFIVAYMFFLPLFLISLLEEKKILWLLVGVLPILAIGLGELNGGGVIMCLIVFTIGSLLGLIAAKLAKIGREISE